MTSSTFIPNFEDEPESEGTNSRGEEEDSNISSSGTSSNCQRIHRHRRPLKSPPSPAPPTTQLPTITVTAAATTTTTDCSDLLSASSYTYNDCKTTIYTFSSNTVAGKCLTRLSKTFLPPLLIHQNHTTRSLITKANTSSGTNNHIDRNDADDDNDEGDSSDSADLTITEAAEETATTNAHIKHGAAFVAFLSLLLVTFANNMLAPMRDAAALALGVNHIPNLTLASTVLAFCSSVPMGWLFEAPNPDRKGKRWRDKVGLTRGDTQGTSLALFYRIFAILLVGYALGFLLVDYVLLQQQPSPSAQAIHDGKQTPYFTSCTQSLVKSSSFILPSQILSTLYCLHTHIQHNYFTRPFFHQVLSKFWAIFYIAFYLVGNLMKLYSVSLLWGVATEAMEYEEQAEIRYINSLRMTSKQNSIGRVREVTSSSSTSSSDEEERRNHSNNHSSQPTVDKNLINKGKGTQSRTRLERLEFVGFGSTLGGILGSMFVSFTAQTLRLPGLLIIAAILLAISAELSVELGQIMLRHWEEEQRERLSNSDLQSLETATSEWMEDTIPSSYSAQVIFIPPNSQQSLQNNNGNVLKTSVSTHELARTISNKYNHIELSMKKTASFGSMKRIASNHGMAQSVPRDGDCVDSSMKKAASFGTIKRISSHHVISQSTSSGSDWMDSSMKKTASFGSMKRTTSNHGISQSDTLDSVCVDSSLKKTASFGSMKRVASNNSMTLRSSNSVGMKPFDSVDSSSHDSPKPSNTSATQPSITQSTSDPSPSPRDHQVPSSQTYAEESLFKQRLLRGISTILRSRLLMTIFTYNALYATTNFLLSYQRAELVANRKKTCASSNGATKKVDSHAAFLAKINIVSNTAVFLLQGSGLGAWIATTLGQRGTLALMPLARVFGVAILVLWHTQNDGSPPNLTLFLVLDELTKVINFAVAKPVRESLWHGLSNEARYEAKPIVDTMANRWGGGSAAFLMSLLGKIMDITGIGGVSVDGSKTLLGFPPVLMLCAVSAIWWTMVSLDLGAIRHRIDLELKKQQ